MDTRPVPEPTTQRANGLGLSLQKSSELMRAFSVFDGFLYGIYAVSIVVAAALTYSLCYPWPAANIPLGIVIVCLAFLPTFTVYAMLTTLMPRAGGDYIWQSRAWGGFWGYLVVFTPLLFGPCFYMASNVAPGSSMVAAPLFISLGNLLGLPALTNFAIWLTTGLGTWWFYVFYVTFAFVVVALGMRFYAKVQRWSFWIGTLAIVTWVVMLLVTSVSGFREAFNSFMAQTLNWGDGRAYQLILEMARAQGFEAVPLSQTRLGPSILIGPVLAYTFMYVAWAGTLAGEIEGVDRFRNAFKIFLGGNLFALVACAGFLWLLISRVGNEFFTSANFLWAGGDVGDLPVAPYYGIFLMALSKSPWVWLWIAVGLNAWFWIWPTNNLVMSTRVMFAMSYDHVLPGFLARVSRRWRVPLIAISLCYVGMLGMGALYFFTDFAKLTLDMPFMTSIAFAGSTLVGTLFPYLKSTRQIYADSPISRYKLFGIPLITVSGSLGLLYFTVMFYLYLTDTRYGTNDPLSALFILGALALSALIYLGYRLYRSRQGLEALRQVSLKLATQLDPDLLLHTIVERAIALVSGRAGHLTIYRPDLDALVLTATAGEGPDLSRTLLRRGEGLAGKIWESGQPLLVNDYRRWGGRAAIYDGLPIRAMIGVPVRWGEEFLGVLSVERETAGAFTLADAELLALFGAQAAIAIHNARLFEEAQQEIAERRRAEEELKSYRDHLEELVRERTSELKIAKEEAEAANRAKSAFLANMSHELRTPLNAILGYAQLLQQRPLAPDVINSLNIVQQSGEHLLILINDILDLSKIEAGRMALSPAPFHLSAFLQDIVSIIHARAEAKGITFYFEALNTLPTSIEADETRLRQVLLNLLDNAIKFTEEGEVVLSVGVIERGREMLLHPHSPPAPNLLTFRFSVRDTGIGISSDQLECIFQPFEQVGNPVHRSKGTGLGLAISRQLVRLMGGEIYVESEPGGGSRFWFDVTFPKAEMTADILQPPERTITGYRGPRRTVLVVDDIPSNRAVLVDLLEPLGFKIVEATNGEQAIQVAQEVRPNLILMDRWMSVMDGFEAAQRMRQTPELADLAVIAVSASVSKEDQAKSRQAGFDAFLSKPIHWPTLAKMLEEHLELVWEIEEAGECFDAEEEEAILVPPPEAEMDVLLDLARRGNLRAIQERAARIATLGEQYVPFARKLRELAKSFEEQELLALVERYREDEGSADWKMRINDG